ncbi:uncharacterized protein N0V96_008953 [Colletotrichum fioriniae]|uniref:uncharacterized protein n=1 Tax=Colletotrichum fioriniae TaxID=710243 RepID=UPI0032D9EDA5|nr:hypothetical protein N0V96_008953 [Colletotrichum fioriniae]
MAEGPNRGRKSALLIGIDQYSNEWLADLRGSLSDVVTTEAFLTQVAGISKMTKLISPPASPNDLLPTFDNITSEFKTLADEAQPGDFIYIHYSGHGTRLPTAFRDLKGDNVRYDECLILTSSDGKLQHLRDVEIAFLLKQIADKGATVTFVLDCCHSGGATRGDDKDSGVRGSEDIPYENFSDLERKPIQSVEDLKDAWRPPTDDDNNAGRGGIVVHHWMTASKGINFLAACRPRQKAQEVPRKDPVRKGLFTDCLATVIAQNRGVDRLPQLSCDVVANLVAHTLKNHKDRDTAQDQDTVFGGQSDCHIFGVESVAQPDVVITNVEKLVSGKLKLGLTAGIAHGVGVGDIFAIYPSDRRLDNLADYAAPLATCSVTAVENFTCKANTQSKAANIERVQVECKAVSLRSILENNVLQPRGVWVSAEDDSPEPPHSVVQKVRSFISRGSGLVVLKDSDKAFFKVLVHKDGSFTIFFTPNQAEANVKIKGEVEDVLYRLEHLTIFYNLFNLAKDNAGQQERGLTVTKIGYLDEDVKPPNPRVFKLNEATTPVVDLKPIPQDSIDISSGQSIGLEVRNTSLDDVYVEILDLEPSWRATRAHPTQRQSPILTPSGDGTRFFVKMSPSKRVDGAVQPDTFDRFVVLATARNRVSFPRTVLPTLGERRGPALEDAGGNDDRAGDVVDQPGWYVQQVDVRVVAEE